MVLQVLLEALGDVRGEAESGNVRGHDNAGMGPKNQAKTVARIWFSLLDYQVESQQTSLYPRVTEVHIPAGKSRQ